MSFVKLDCGVLDSSLWVERDARSVFFTALLMAKPYVIDEPTPTIAVRSMEPGPLVIPPGRYGLVQAAGSGIIRRDGIETEAGWRALEALAAPDPESRSEEYEGRRIARISGGYVVLNFARYRDFDDTAAERSRRYRERLKEDQERRNATGVTRDEGNGSASASPSGSESVETANNENPFKGKSDDEFFRERDAILDRVARFLAAHDFGRWKDSVTGLIRSARMPLAVVAELELYLSGEMAHPKQEPEVLGYAANQYLAQFSAEGFKTNLFAGVVRGTHRGLERHDNARRAGNETAAINREERERDERERESAEAAERAVELILDEAKKRLGVQWEDLNAKAEASVDPKFKGRMRATLVRDKLLDLIKHAS